MGAKTVLVIEDDQSTQLYLEKILKENGYKVITANDGKEGIAKAKETPPAVIICDIMMPDTDGYQVLEELRNDEEFTHVPFLFLSVLNERENQRKGMELGADDFLYKPVRADELIKAVSVRLDRIESLKYYEVKPSSSGRLGIDQNIFLQTNDKIKSVRTGDIVSIQADGVYSNIYTVDGKRFLIRKIIKEWEEMVPEEYFYRVHKSHIININQIEYIERQEGATYKVVLKGLEEPVFSSHRYSKVIRQLLVK